MIKIPKTLAAALLALTAGTAAAESRTATAAESEREEKPMFIQPMIGLSYTLGESSFGSLLSPAFSVKAGYDFDRRWSGRIDFGGWEAKGDAMFDYKHHTYTFNYLQLSADAVVDWTSYIWPDERRYSGYAFIGIGCNWRFSNSEAHALAREGYPYAYLWDGTRTCFAGRGGIGGRYILTDDLSINAEITVNGLSDHFNSKHGRGGNPDWIFSLSAGVTYRFGQPIRLTREKAFIPNF